ncbi:sugar ABC transporter substrate-binding protein [Candidatus Poribacteria bacterium]|nr:sugar ABC transporter substrate-binding protein [Candidatus Poribacteria bacterium]
MFKSIDSESFPLGKGPMVMLILFLISTVFILARSSERGEGLEFWVFASTHFEEYQARVPIFEAQHPGVKVHLTNFGNSMHDKLLTAMLSNFGAPDLVEVEITSIGRFLKGAIDEVGFINLRPRLESEGWMEKLVVSRFTPWSYRERIFGIPHDLHPVVLLYRDDLFKAAGVDLTQVETWADFIEAGKKATRDLDGDGAIDQYAIVLDRRTSSDFFNILLQRDGGFFDQDGNIIIDSELAIETLEFVADMFNKHQIATPVYGTWHGDPSNFAAMQEGRILSIMAPDWYVGILKSQVPQMSGKWRAISMPAWEIGQRRTTTRGGTMIGITKQSETRKKEKLAWEFLKFIYFDRQGLVNRYDKTRIIPPLKAAWDAPIFSEPDPYLGGQQLGKLFTKLASEIPARYQNPYWSEADDLLNDAVFAVITQKQTAEVALRELAEKVRALMRKDQQRWGEM